MADYITIQIFICIFFFLLQSSAPFCVNVLLMPNDVYESGGCAVAALLSEERQQFRGTKVNPFASVLIQLSTFKTFLD